MRSENWLFVQSVENAVVNSCFLYDTQLNGWFARASCNKKKHMQTERWCDGPLNMSASLYSREGHLSSKINKLYEPDDWVYFDHWFVMWSINSRLIVAFISMLTKYAYRIHGWWYLFNQFDSVNRFMALWPPFSYRYERWIRSFSDLALDNEHLFVLW